MKETISEFQFIDAFKQNESRKDQFSYEALQAIYAYLTECEESTGEEIELDIVAICCDFTEYESFEELKECYNVESMEELKDKTIVMELESGGLVIKDY